ncbi:MAG TPA: molybdopterin-dependent oxidoreductase [Acidimicrobiales bacterium]|nr:molybdopterin-dependent oxidoreductase [Acidimicrobiales bacterium]
MTTAGDPGPRQAAPLAGAAGCLAAGLALAVGELAGAVSTRVPSLVTVVGQAFIREAPAGFGRAAIETVGRRDKPLVVAGTVLGALAIGIAAGVLARRRPRVGDAAFVVFGALAVACAARIGEVSTAGTAAGATAAALAGAVALRLLLSALWAGPDDPVAVPPPLAPAPAPDAGVLLPGSGVSRRRFLSAASVAGGATGAALAAGWAIRRTGAGAPEPVATRLPPAADPAPAPAGAEALHVEGLSPLVTPTGRFFRIDEALVAPAVDLRSWRLRVTGLVDTPLELTYDQLLAEPLVERHITLACVSSEVGGPLVGTSRWLGVPLAHLLRRAGVRPDATQVVGRSVDGFTAGFPVEVAMDGRDALVAVAMEGRPLPRVHGFPARLVVPGLYGYLSATKWLRQIELTTWDAFDAYWVERGWAGRAPVKVQSRIDVPRPFGDVAAGRRTVAGVAWAPGRGIGAVEVKVDDGPWRQAGLGPSLGDDAWRQWATEWTAAPGHHAVTVRATTADGEKQTAVKHAAFPDGATGRHQVEVWVRE